MRKNKPDDKILLFGKELRIFQILSDSFETYWRHILARNCKTNKFFSQ